MTSVTLQLPYPVSVNAIWRVYKGRQSLTAEARQYRNQIKYAATKAKAYMIHGAVSVVIELQPKLTISGRASKVLMDLDNCIKATLDGLQGIVIDNDRNVKRLYAYYGEPVENGGLIITVEKYEH